MLRFDMYFNAYCTGPFFGNGIAGRASSKFGLIWVSPGYSKQMGRAWWATGWTGPKNYDPWRSVYRVCH